MKRAATIRLRISEEGAREKSREEVIRSMGHLRHKKSGAVQETKWPWAFECVRMKFERK
jgi:hypothetical protein